MWRLFSNKRVYLDYASATPVAPEAARAAARAAVFFGNPGAIHSEGVAAKKILQDARENIAAECGVKARQVIFTSGGTEGNNIAILGLARKFALAGEDISETHWIVSAIEHPSVLDCFGEIERLGGQVTHLDPDERGIIRAEIVDRALRPNTRLLSIGWANHEIGTVQPLREIARVIRAHAEKNNSGVLLHVDAGQSPLYIAPHLHAIDADIVTLDSGKLYGPRGVGVLVLSNRTELAKILLGGGQERGLRAGTENVALAAGFAAALSLVGGERKTEETRIRKMRDELARAVATHIPEAVVNGSLSHSVPHILNISIPDIESEYVTLALDRAGFAVSTKSACREGEERSSHVVAALGNAPNASSSEALAKEERARNTLRFSLGRETRQRDMARLLRELEKLFSKKSVL